MRSSNNYLEKKETIKDSNRICILINMVQVSLISNNSLNHCNLSFRLNILNIKILIVFQISKNSKAYEIEMRVNQQFLKTQIILMKPLS
jgi:hypothetical protein